MMMSGFILFNVYVRHHKYPTFRALFLGMSFGVRFKVRTFGNKHPDGSNVRMFFSEQFIILHVHLHVC